MPNPPLLLVTHGGHQVCAPADGARQRARQWSVAWKISVVLDGGTVRVRHVLPGLHLDLRAKRRAEHLPSPYPATIWPSLTEDDWAWEHIEEAVCSMVRNAKGFEQCQYESFELSCFLRQQSMVQDAAVPIAFTMECRWPDVLGSWVR